MIKRRTKDYYLGGIVRVKNPTKREQQNVDTQPAILQAGSLVIPKPHAELVKQYLKENNINIDKKNTSEKDASKVVNAILVVGELIIPPQYVKQVVRFLRLHNINLPNTDNIQV